MFIISQCNGPQLWSNGYLKAGVSLELDQVNVNVKRYERELGDE